MGCNKMDNREHKKYTVGYTCGVFDLLHEGHLILLERCKSFCDKLIVGVCDDNYVKNVKRVKPVFSENERVRVLKALKVVDDAQLVTIEETEDKMLALERFHFDVLFSGDDWKGTERYNQTEKMFAGVGVAIEYLPYTKGVSTSQLKDSLKGNEKD